MSATQDEIQVTPYTTLAVCGGLLYLVLTFLGYCYVDDTKPERSHRFKRLLTFYNLFFASFHMLQAILLLEVIGAEGSLLGLNSKNSSRGVLVIQVHAVARLVHIMDTVILLSSSQRSAC